MKAQSFVAGLLCWGAVQLAAQGCDERFLPGEALAPVMQKYLQKLQSTAWEGVYPFDRMEGQAIYLSEDFDSLNARQKRHVLSLLLLDYGAYQPFLSLLSPQQRQQISRQQGSMLPYTVYAADGRVVSLAYNACNRLTLLTEYERSRLGFLGVESERTQRYPMSRWQQEEVKKVFWNTLGYDKAGAYWLAWVPEQGYFEINVPDLGHKALLDFWPKAPNYYRYLVVFEGTRLYSYFRGQKTYFESPEP